MIKLIALDLDGTTLNSRHTMSEKTVETLLEAQRRGIIVTIATGRMLRAAAPFAEILGIKAPLIVYNGAMIADARGNIIREYKLDPAIARRLLQIAREHGVMLQTYTDDTLIVDKINSRVARYARVCRVPAKAVGDIGAYWREDAAPTKVLYIAEESLLNELWPRIREEFGGSIFSTKSTPYYLEMINPAANKGAGLRAVADHYGIGREEIMVCGDSLNDLELFKAAGLSVAVANAMPELQRQADHITLSNDEDGVAEAVRRFALI